MAFTWDGTNQPQSIPTDHPGMGRDTKTGALLNNNAGEYQEFISKRQRAKEFLSLKADMETLKAQFLELSKEINVLKGH